MLLFSLPPISVLATIFTGPSHTGFRPRLSRMTAVVEATPWLIPLALTVAGLLLALYHLSYRHHGLRVKPLYLALAACQVFQYLFTSRALWPDAAQSPSLGSAVLFPTVLMLILVIYIRKDIFEFY